MAHVFKRSRSPYWQARLSVGGTYVKVSTGIRVRGKGLVVPANVQDWADAEESRRNQQLERDTGVAGLRFSEAATWYFANCGLKPKTISNYKVNKNAIERKLGDFWLNDLTKDMVEGYLKLRALEGRSASARQERQFLASLYDTCAIRDDGPKTNPAAEIDMKRLKIRKVQKRKRWLTEAEAKRLIDSCTTAMHKEIVTIAIQTGMRKNEILHLRWSEVDIDRRMIVLGNLDVSRTKTSTGRIIPLTDEAISALNGAKRRQSNRPSEWVFPSPKTGEPIVEIKTWWYGACTRAGFKTVEKKFSRKTAETKSSDTKKKRPLRPTELHFHDLRHTFSTWALNRGVNPLAVQQWLGHKTASQTADYSHVSEEALMQAALQFGNGAQSGAQPTESVGHQGSSAVCDEENQGVGGADARI